MSSSIAFQLGRLIALLLRVVRSPLLIKTFAILAAGLGTLAASSTFFELLSRDGSAKNISYESQLMKLDDVQQSIQSLNDFVNFQRREIEERQSSVLVLQSEQKKLKSVAELDRNVVEALFELQERRSRRNIWAERLIGFLVGIASSLAANNMGKLKHSQPSNAPSN